MDERKLRMDRWQQQNVKTITRLLSCKKRGINGCLQGVNCMPESGTEDKWKQGCGINPA